MIDQPVLSHRFIFGSRAPPVAVRINGNAAARGELAPDFNIAGLHQGDQIIHNNVYTVLMEIPMVPEAEQIELQ
ncbi:hypothetical protein D3C85_1756630 [compost metagenome]